MILSDAGKEAVELSSESIQNTTKTLKKTLTSDEGIFTDDDKYDVSEMLAKGGMGMVMAAKDLNIRRPGE